MFFKKRPPETAVVLLLELPSESKSRRGARAPRRLFSLQLLRFRRALQSVFAVVSGQIDEMFRAAPFPLPLGVAT